MISYEKIIESYSKGEISYEKAKEDISYAAIFNGMECPWNNSKEEFEKMKRAYGLLEELRFNRMYKD